VSGPARPRPRFRRIEPPRLLQTAAFRIALLFLGTFSVAAGFLVGVLWFATAGALDRQTIAAIRADTAALIERHREQGLEGLVDAIEDRLALDVAAETLYLLIDGQGRKLAGNLEGWPTPMDEGGPWFRTRFEQDGVISEARVHWRELDGLRLLVGRDESERV
jgi:hypothetical protein